MHESTRQQIKHIHPEERFLREVQFHTSSIQRKHRLRVYSTWKHPSGSCISVNGPWISRLLLMWSCVRPQCCLLSAAEEQQRLWLSFKGRMFAARSGAGGKRGGIRRRFSNDCKSSQSPVFDPPCSCAASSCRCFPAWARPHGKLHRLRHVSSFRRATLNKPSRCTNYGRTASLSAPPCSLPPRGGFRPTCGVKGQRLAIGRQSKTTWSLITASMTLWGWSIIRNCRLLFFL